MNWSIMIKHNTKTYQQSNWNDFSSISFVFESIIINILIFYVKHFDFAFWNTDEWFVANLEHILVFYDGSSMSRFVNLLICASIFVFVCVHVSIVSFLGWFFFRFQSFQWTESNSCLHDWLLPFRGWLLCFAMLSHVWIDKPLILFDYPDCF